MLSIGNVLLRKLSIFQNISFVDKYNQCFLRKHIAFLISGFAAPPSNVAKI